MQGFHALCCCVAQWCLVIGHTPVTAASQPVSQQMTTVCNHGAVSQCLVSDPAKLLGLPSTLTANSTSAISDSCIGLHPRCTPQVICRSTEIIRTAGVCVCASNNCILHGASGWSVAHCGSANQSACLTWCADMILKVWRTNNRQN